MSNRPNWFIGWPFDAEVELGDVPPKVRRFVPKDRHTTSVFLGPVRKEVAQRAWALIHDDPGKPVTVSLGPVRLLGGVRPSAVSAIIDRGADDLRAMMMNHRQILVDAALMPKSDREPLPHVTLARVQRSASKEQHDIAVQWAEGLTVEAKTVFDRLALYTWSEDRTASLFTIRAEVHLFASAARSGGD